MAETSSPLPLDKMFLIGIWVQTVLYGVNTVLFFTAIFILAKRRRSDRPPWFLFAMMTCLYALCTAYSAICLRQLLIAFIELPRVPGAAVAFFANQPHRLSITKLILFEITVFAQDLIVIWRLWVVWGNSWKIVVVPLILEACHVASGFVSIARGSQPNVPIFDPIIRRWTTVYWSLDLVMNTSVTAGIVYKLWVAGRTIQHLTHRDHKYKGPIFTVIESGAIYASMTLVLFALLLNHNPALVVVLDVAAQLATLTPLLIVVRVGLGLNHTRSVNTTYSSTLAGTDPTAMRFSASASHNQISVDIATTQTSYTDNDYPLKNMAKHTDEEV